MWLGSGSGWRALCLALAFCGCSGDPPKRSSFDDVGAVCLSLGPDGVVNTVVQFPTCLTSCDSAREPRCQVTVDGSTLVVNSHAVSERTDDRAACSVNCVPFYAHCASSDMVSPGSYTVVLGAKDAPILLGSQQTCLFTDTL